MIPSYPLLLLVTADIRTPRGTLRRGAVVAGDWSGHGDHYLRIAGLPGVLPASAGLLEVAPDSPLYTPPDPHGSPRVAADPPPPKGDPRFGAALAWVAARLDALPADPWWVAAHHVGAARRALQEADLGLGGDRYQILADALTALGRAEGAIALARRLAAPRGARPRDLRGWIRIARDGETRAATLAAAGVRSAVSASVAR